MTPDIIRISENKELIPIAARWFSERWGIDVAEYTSSMRSSEGGVPEWYLAMWEGKIVGGVGVIENDFHPRRDLTPNVCAVYVLPEYRGKGIAGRLLNFACEDLALRGVDTLYLLTDHIGFYERYGWEPFTEVTGFGEDSPSRMYIHKIN